MQAAICATSLTGAKRSRRAMSRSCSVSGISSSASGARELERRLPASRSAPNSSTVLVSSSTNSGTPSVRRRIRRRPRQATPAPRPPSTPARRLSADQAVERQGGDVGVFRPERGGIGSKSSRPGALAVWQYHRRSPRTVPERGGIKPLGIFQRHQQWLPSRQVLEMQQKGPEGYAVSSERGQA